MPEPVSSMPTNGFTPSGAPVGVGGGDPTQNIPGLPNGVNVAQPSNSFQQQQQSFGAPSATSFGGNTNPSQTSSLMEQLSAQAAAYEQRISRLMSEKDKALSNLTLLQSEYTHLRDQTTTSLSASSDAAQSAINDAKTLRTQNDALQRELRRSQVLDAYPDLRPYAKFIPTTGTDEEQQQKIEELKAIREQDLQRLSAGHAPIGANPLAEQPANGVNPQLNPFQSLYGNRPTINPMLGVPTPPIPGSNPSAVNPAGTGNTSAMIDKMLKESMHDPVKFAEALEKAKVFSTQAINEQMGRG